MFHFDVTSFGARGDGSTNDQPAIQAAIQAASDAGGAIVFFPPTGHAYLISKGLVVPQGVLLKGAGTRSSPLPNTNDNMTRDVWDHHGTWLHCTDTDQSAISITGSGAGVDGINLFYEQPLPKGTTWVPQQWPWAIAANGAGVSHLTFRNIMIIGATHGLILNFGLCTVGGGTGTIIDNVYMIAFIVGVQVIGSNDTIYVNDLSVVNIFFPPQTAVFALKNLIGLRFTHAENPVVTNFQVLAAKWGIFVENGNNTLVNNPIGVINGLFSNIQLNLCSIGVGLATIDTQLVAQFQNVLAQNTPLSFITHGIPAPPAGALFDLQSHEVDVTFSNLTMAAAHTGIILGDGASRSALGSGPRVVATGVRARWNLDGGTDPLFNITANAAVFLGISDTLDSRGGSLKVGGGRLVQVSTTTS